MRLLICLVLLVNLKAYGEELYYEYLFDKSFKSFEVLLVELPDGSYFGEEVLKISKSASTIYIEFSVCKTLDDSNWKVEVIDGDGENLFSLGEMTKNCEDFTLGPISEPLVTFSASFEKVDEFANVKVRRILRKNLDVVPRSYQNPDSPNIEDIGLGDDIFDMSTGVAILSIDNDIGRYTCSGFLVDGNSLLTNLHCITEKTSCSDIEVEFDYYSYKTKDRSKKVDLCEDLILGSYALDWAIVKLKSEQVDRFIFKPFEGSITEKKPLIIIHHPEGMPKKVTKSNCIVVSYPVTGNSSEFLGKPYLVQQDFSHNCDTAYGSSGAPVIDYDGKVLGLHHAGFKQSEKINRVNKAVSYSLVNKVLNIHLQ